jgi:uncharacterized protein YkwD
MSEPNRPEAEPSPTLHPLPPVLPGVEDAPTVSTWVWCSGALAALLLCGCSLPEVPQVLGNVTGPLTATATPASGQTCGDAAFQQQALVKINAYRAAGARCGQAGSFPSAAALSWNPALAQAAAAHSQDMAQRQQLDHRGSDGRTLAGRLEAQGYRCSDAAENIAAGQPDLTRVLAAWVGSSSHCANLLAPTAREMGLACRRAGDGQLYWTLVVAQPQAPVSAVPPAPATGR